MVAICAKVSGTKRKCISTFRKIQFENMYVAKIVTLADVQYLTKGVLRGARYRGLLQTSQLTFAGALWGQWSVDVLL